MEKNVKTIETVERERERESNNLKDNSFISNAKKLHVKYKKLKINVATRGEMLSVKDYVMLC